MIKVNKMGYISKNGLEVKVMKNGFGRLFLF